MLKILAFGLVAFVGGLWKVGISWDFFLKFAVFELATLICKMSLLLFFLWSQLELQLQVGK